MSSYNYWEKHETHFSIKLQKTKQTSLAINLSVSNSEILAQQLLYRFSWLTLSIESIANSNIQLSE